MSLSLFESEASRIDVAEIWDYIAFGNPVSGDPSAADRVILAIVKTYGTLCVFPHRSKIKNRNLYRATVEGFHQYNIIYRFDHQKLEILRVLRSDLDWTRIVEEF